MSKKRDPSDNRPAGDSREKQREDEASGKEAPSFDTEFRRVLDSDGDQARSESGKEARQALDETRFQPIIEDPDGADRDETRPLRELPGDEAREALPGGARDDDPATVFQPHLELEAGEPEPAASESRRFDSRKGALPPVPDLSGEETASRASSQPSVDRHAPTAAFPGPAVATASRSVPWALLGVILLLLAGGWLGWKYAGGSEAVVADEGQRAVEQLRARVLSRATSLSSRVSQVLAESRVKRNQLATLESRIQAAEPEQIEQLADERNRLSRQTARIGQQAILIRDHVLEGIDFARIEALTERDAGPAELEAELKAVSDRLEAAGQRFDALDQALRQQDRMQALAGRWRSLGFSWPPVAEELGDLPEPVELSDIASRNAEADELLEAGRFSQATQLLREAAQELENLVEQAQAQGSMSRQRIQTLLAQAELALEANQLTSPSNDNALMYYQLILEAEPEHPAARAGLERIVDAYAKLLDSALARKEIEAARGFLERARSVDPGAPALGAMESRFRQARAQWTRERLSVLRSDAEQALERGDEAALRTLRDEAARLDPGGEVERFVSRAYAESLKRPGRRFSDVLPEIGASAPEMVVLPSGRFTMGESGRQLMRIFGVARNETPDHEVVIESPFSLSRREVTVADYRRFVDATGYRSDAENDGPVTVLGPEGERQRSGWDWRRGWNGEAAEPDQPVLHVSWNDAVAYARWLSERTGHRYRLPTESEFEYALRAGNGDRFAWSGRSIPEGQGNFNGEADPAPGGWTSRPQGGGELRDYRDGYFGVAPAGRFAANAFGLHDMLGNVAEWTRDCYLPDYEGKGSSPAARESSGCRERTVRGASWASEDQALRLSWRRGVPAGRADNRIGFRVARDFAAE